MNCMKTQTFRILDFRKARVDSVTQAVLGGVVSYAILSKHIGKRAALYGAAFGTLPDLDVLIDFGGPIENMIYHRGFSHSFLIQAFVAPVFAWMMARPKRFTDIVFLKWWLAIFLCFVTHSLADLLQFMAHRFYGRGQHIHFTFLVIYY